MKHEEKHAIGMWLVAAFLGGFAMLLWWVGRMETNTEVPPPPSIEQRDTTA